VPLIRGGSRQVSLIVLLALAILLLAVIGAEATYLSLQNKDERSGKDAILVWRRVALAMLLSCPIWLGLIYLLPIPADSWRSLPGRELYFTAMNSMKLALPSTFPLSLSADGTLASLLAGVPLVAMFAAAQFLPIKAIKSLLWVLILCSTLQVLLAVLQLALGADSIFYFDLQVGGVVIGSFANRNHLANYLVLQIPIYFYFFFSLMQSDNDSKLPKYIGSHRQIVILLLLFLGFSLILILLTTMSRGGLISGFIALGVSIGIYLIVLGKSASHKQRYVYFALFIVFISLALLTTGLDGIQSRLGERFLTDAEVRNAIAHATLTAASQFWPWGSGLGSFEAVFPRFQSAISIGYIEYAHNDYAQLLMELGLVGVILMAAFAILLIHQVLNVVRVYRAEQRLPKVVVMQCFCGVGLLAFLFHSWVEFNMHIPALAITAAFLSGVFLRNFSSEQSR
jgi:O-antigen ligase